MNPHRKIRSSPASPATSRPVRIGVSFAVLVLIPVIATTGSDAAQAAFDHTSGVLCLVALTGSVVWGLLATDRLLLRPRHRLVAQAVHRATAMSSLAFLLLHATVKVALGHVAPIGALLPFGLGVTGSAGLIGLGSLAGLLMIVTALTGALRSAFAVPGAVAGRWRALHALAYPAWCFALVHGLYAGREPAGWVVALYGLSLAAVAGALSLRLLPPPLKRRAALYIGSLTRHGGPPAREGDPVRDTGSVPLPGVSGTLPPPLPQEPPRSGRNGPAPPSQRVYEAPPRPPLPSFGPGGGPGPDPRAGRGIDPRAGRGVGSGISAAYRAVAAAPRDPAEPLTTGPPQSARPQSAAGAPGTAGGDDGSAASPTDPSPWPYRRPAAGEPWHAPAGERQ